MPVTTYNNTCKPLSEKKRENLEKKTEDLPKKIKDLSEEMASLKNKAEETQLRIRNQINELKKQAREEDLREKETQRRMVAERQNQILNGQKRIRELNTQMLEAQGEIAKIIAQRAYTLTKFSSAAIQQDCLRRIQQIYDEMSKSNPNLKAPKRLRSANSLIAQGSSRAKLEQDMFQQCRRELLEIRNQTLTDYQSKIDLLEARIADSDAEIKSIQASINLLLSQSEEQDKELQQSKTQKLQERMEEMNSLLMRLASQQQLFQQKMASNQQELQRLQTELRKASIELATADGRPTEAVLPEEFTGLYNDLISLYENRKECRDHVKNLEDRINEATR